jgi:fatty-acyl-CoA synthase
LEIFAMTPTENSIALRQGDFGSLAEALDYAASGDTGYNFYDSRGRHSSSLTYTELRQQSQELAACLGSLGLVRGSRVALIADTGPDFVRAFYACQYAGLTPVPLPVPTGIGSHDAYVLQLRGMLESCKAQVALASDDWVAVLGEAVDGCSTDDYAFIGTVSALHALPDRQTKLQPLAGDDIAYLQYTSGSTQFPRGVMVTGQQVMANLAAIIRDGVEITHADRCMSWLPFYHDMGLVGLLLTPMAAQVSVDFLATRDFAMRPRLWLKLMSENRGTISFGPPFGYELVTRRLRPGEAANYDLSAWRVAGVGAETIRPSVLNRFGHVLSQAGFAGGSFLACYGMAECALAISFAPLGAGIDSDRVDRHYLAAQDVAMPVDGEPGPDSFTEVSEFVDCGSALPGYQIEVRDEQGKVLPERHNGTVFVRGPSVMKGYFNDADRTAECLSNDGWLNTGDLGYRRGNSLVLTGREKDLIIVRGRNIWPQDVEYIAEQRPEVRSGDAVAFAVQGGPAGEDHAVVLVQSRELDDDKRDALKERIQARVRQELLVDCLVALVPAHTLPRTSSGKLSRSRARTEYLQTIANGGYDKAASARIKAQPSSAEHTAAA